MTTEPPVRLNTVEKAVQLARVLSREVASQERKAYRNYQIFAALTHDEREAFAAFVIWRARAEVT